MKLNLHILSEDIADLGCEASFADRWDVRPIRLAAYSDGTGVLHGDRVYIMHARNVHMALAGRSERLNVVCVGGVPPVQVLESGLHNLAWIKNDVSPTGLVERLNDRIAFYNDWKDEVDSLLAVNAPFRRIAEITEPLFGNPLWMWDSQLQTVFHVMRRDCYVIPSDYQEYPEGVTWPMSGVNAINEEFMDALKKTEPYVLPPMFGYESLCFNLFDGGIHAATLCVDGLGARPFCERDFALIQLVGEMMNEGIKYQPHFSRHATFTMSAQMEKLLAGGNVPKNRLAASLGKKGWSIDDTYFCIVAKQRRESTYSEILLIPTAETICDAVRETTSVIADGSMIFITNYTLSELHPSRVCEAISAQLDSLDVRMRLGVSTPFTDFTALPFFRDQAEEAILLGKRVDSEARVFYFHDYMMAAIVRRCMRDTIPEVLFPPSLSRLMRYDKAHGGDLVPTLKAYLDNDMSTNKTASSLFMHRNTLLSRLKKMEEVGGFDLEDNETRFLLSIAFALME